MSQQHPGIVSCGPTEAQRSRPRSDFANTHTGACHPPAPEPSTCSINRLVIRVPSNKQWLPDQRFCQLAFSHHHLSGRPASIPEACTESSITSLWVQRLASVQEWCERERLWNQTHLGLFHTQHPDTGGKLLLCVCVRHAASSSLTRDRAQAPCVGSVQS